MDNLNSNKRVVTHKGLCQLQCENSEKINPCFNVTIPPKSQLYKELENEYYEPNDILTSVLNLRNLRKVSSMMSKKAFQERQTLKATFMYLCIFY